MKNLAQGDPLYFDWPVFVDGYFWTEPRKDAYDDVTSFLTPAQPWGRGRTTRPLETEPALFLEFAKLAPTPEAIRAFVTEHGLLLADDFFLNVDEYGEPVKDELAVPADSFDTVCEEIAAMRQVVSLALPLLDGDADRLPKFRWVGEGALREIHADGVYSPELCKTGPIVIGYGASARTFNNTTHPRIQKARTLEEKQKLLDALHSIWFLDIYPELLEAIPPGDPFRATRLIIGAIVNPRLQSRVSPAFLWEFPRARMYLNFMPVNLLSALWLQCATAIDRHQRHATCVECGRWFEVTSDKGRIYCRDACKSRAWRRRQREQEGGGQ